VAVCLGRLPALYDRLGDLVRSGPLHEQAVQLHKQVFGAEHPRYATALLGLARFQLRMNDLGRAEASFREVMAIRRMSLGEQAAPYREVVPELADALARAAERHLEREDFAAAERA